MVKFNEIEPNFRDRNVTKRWRSENTEHGHYDAFLYEDGTYYLKWWGQRGKGASRVAAGIKSMEQLQEIADIHDLCTSNIAEAIARANAEFNNFIASENLDPLSDLFR